MSAKTTGDSNTEKTAKITASQRYLVWAPNGSRVTSGKPVFLMVRPP